MSTVKPLKSLKSKENPPKKKSMFWTVAGWSAGLLALCCVGVFALALADVGVRKIGLLPTYTPTSTRTPTPLPPPPTATGTPEPTAQALLFADIVQNPAEKNWSASQYTTYLDTIKGRQVSGWSGTVLEIDEYGGKPYISLDAKPGEPKIDIYAYISKEDVLKVGLGQNVTIAGTISDSWSENNGYNALQLENVTLETLGDIPPTPTPAPTRTPTPDVGNDLTAQTMCKQFVTQNLKSPSSADFGGFFDDRDQAVFIEAGKAASYGVDTAKLRNSGVWVVRGQVDAQNSFGAMIRSDYTCVMDYDKSDQTWYLLDISIK